MIVERLAARLQRDPEARERVSALLRGVDRLVVDCLGGVAGLRERSLSIDDEDRRAARADDRRRVQRVVLVGDPADPHVDAKRGVVGDGVEVPALVPGQLGPRIVAALIGRGGNSAGGLTPGSGSSDSASRSSTCWAARSSWIMNMSSPRSVRTTTIDAAIAISRLWKVWRRYSSQHVSHDRPAAPVGEQLVVVETHELLLVGASILDRQAATDEVRDVEHRGAPGHGLPVDDATARVIEQEVVEPVVAVDESERGPPVFRPAVDGRDEALADLRMLRSDPILVALEEPRQQHLEQRLVERRGLVEPRGGAEVRVAEHRGVDAGQGAERHARLVHAAAGDLIALPRSDDVLKHEREPAVAVDRRVPAFRQRLLDPRGELPVERDLPRVRAHALSGRSARRILGGELDDDGVFTVEGDPIALAHLPGADLLDARDRQIRVAPAPPTTTPR